MAEMWIDIKAAKNSPGKNYTGPLAIQSVEKGTSGDTRVIFDGERTPTSHTPPTGYSGTMDFELEEIVQLFRIMVRNGQKSDDFKRVCDAVADELLDKPR